MQAVLLSLVVVAVGEQPTLQPAPEPSPMVVQGDTWVEGAEACPECGARGACGHRGCGHKDHGFWDCVVDWWGPMPQTCYGPTYGCYPGNNRHLRRYPAFHGYYYRAPYNYRQYFDYPWHAAPHEPLGYFSQPLPAEPGTEAIPGQMPPGNQPYVAPPSPPAPVESRVGPLSPERSWR